jgi:hypothetical protein
MTDWRLELVEMETTARERNEWIEQAHDSLGDNGPTYEFVCECSDSRCTSTIGLSRSDYEEIRAHSVRFVIAPNHENPELDRIVQESESFTVVEKLPGEPARIAHASYQRT